MQYYRKSGVPAFGTLYHVITRNDHSIPGMVPAQDVWIFAEDDTRDPDRLYMTIKNPSKSYRNAYSI